MWWAPVACHKNGNEAELRVLSTSPHAGSKSAHDWIELRLDNHTNLLVGIQEFHISLRANIDHINKTITIPAVNQQFHYI
jgi:hypothetical protein